MELMVKNGQHHCSNQVVVEVVRNGLLDEPIVFSAGIDWMVWRQCQAVIGRLVLEGLQK